MNASSGMGMVGAIVWMVVLFGIMYFLMLRPQKKEQKRLQAMLNDMEVGALLLPVDFMVLSLI